MTGASRSRGSPRLDSKVVHVEQEELLRLRGVFEFTIDLTSS